MRKIIFGLFAAGLLSACGGSSAPTADIARSGPWDLNAKPSKISYLTIKNGDIAENNTFSLFSGSVSPAGEVSIDIALNSLATNIDTRDVRMKKIVFNTDNYPSALITTALALGDFEAMETGARKAVSSEVTVSLAGLSSRYDAEFMVTRLGANSALVESAAPILVGAADFGLTEEVAELQALAKLDSITPVVPVSFSLVFER